MEKEIYWIDDSFLSIQNMENCYREFWGLDKKENIKNIILLLGDFWLKECGMDEYTNHTENNYKRCLMNMFKNYCEEIEQGKRTHELFKEKKYLLDNFFKIINKKPEEDTLQKELYELFNKVCNLWEDNDMISDPIKYEEAKNDANLLIEKLNIPNNAYVAIDCILMSGDYERVKNKEKILSMEIFNRLSQNNINKCFMYSEYINDVKLVSSWKQTYNNCYDEKAEIPFFKRIKFESDYLNGYEFVNKIREIIINGEEITSNKFC